MILQQINGRKWEYRNDSSRIAGDLTPVSSYSVSLHDHTPAEPGEHGHVWTGFVEVAGWDEIPDPAFYNGIRREMRVHGPVVNRDRSVLLDEAPVCVLA